MGKYISSIKDLVILVMTNDSQVIYKANSGEPESCFQVGMMHLLGINTPVDFKKASHYLNNQSLVVNQDATLLLAFISECEGDFSKAFRQYAKTVSGETDTYIEKVIKGRNNLQDLLKNLDLPISFNKEISSILKDYGKGKSSRTGASIKIAAICNDKQTCIEAAKCLFDAKDYTSAIDWLKRGNVGLDNSMYKTINEELRKTTLDLLNSKDLQVINLESNSLLLKEDPTPFLNKVKETCNEASMKCSKEWKDKTKSSIDKIIEDKKSQDYLAALAEEEEAKRRKSGRYILIGIAVLVLLGILVSLLPSSSDKETETKEVTSEKIGELNSLETNKTEVKEDVLSEEYLRNYLDETLPVAIKMQKDKAVQKYFSNEFIDLYKRVNDYDNETGEIGFWDADFWTDYQDGTLKNASVLHVLDLSNNKATVTIQYIIYIDGHEKKELKPFEMIFENNRWLIDDLNNYKDRLRSYLPKDDRKGTSSVDDNQYIIRLINNLSEVRLSEADLADLSKEDLEIMRNSIYARYGYRFNRADLLEYFSRYSWYSPTTNDMESIYNRMNDNEKYNIEFIKKHE